MKLRVWASGQLVSGLLVGRVLLGNVCSDVTLPLPPQAAAPADPWAVPSVPGLCLQRDLGQVQLLCLM